MNKLQKLLTSFTKINEYRVKFAMEPSKKDLERIVTRLETRYDAVEVTPLMKTIFLDRPTDFPELDCGEIWWFDFKCERGVQTNVLTHEIGFLLSWPETFIHVRNMLEPRQEEMTPAEDGIEELDFDEVVEPLLLDPEYSEYPHIDGNELAGQDRADAAVKDAIDEYNKDRTPYAEYMSAGFGKKG